MAKTTNKNPLLKMLNNPLANTKKDRISQHLTYKHININSKMLLLYSNNNFIPLNTHLSVCICSELLKKFVFTREFF